MQSTKNPVSLSKKPSTALKPKPNILSERKQRNEEIIEDQKGVKQQLHFETDSANGMLAHKLSETSVSDSKTPFQPFGGIKPLFPVEQVNFWLFVLYKYLLSMFVIFLKTNVLIKQQF